MMHRNRIILFLTATTVAPVACSARHGPSFQLADVVDGAHAASSEQPLDAESEAAEGDASTADVAEEPLGDNTIGALNPEAGALDCTCGDVDAAALESDSAVDAGSDRPQDVSAEGDELDMRGNAEPDSDAISMSDAPAEASLDDAGDTSIGPDGASVSETLTIIRAEQGDACAACAAIYCLNGEWTCEALGGATATAGPSNGTLRSTLCDNALSCLLDSTPATPCYESGTFPLVCFCGPTTASDVCSTNGPSTDAQCAAVELAGLETTDPVVAWNRYGDDASTFGTQIAVTIANCLDTTCGNDCLPGY